MPKKSLILYASISGNTEKVALRFKQVFEKMGWECDMVKINKKTPADPPPFDVSKYDFMCVGSYIHQSAPSQRLLHVMYYNPASAHYDKGQWEHANEPLEEPGDEAIAEISKKNFDPHNGKINMIHFDHNDKKGIVFVTFGGEHQGRKEAVPSLELLASEMEHLRFECLGKFECPGKFAKARAWFQDLPDRPHERDLMKAQIFLEEILEELEWSSRPNNMERYT